MLPTPNHNHANSSNLRHHCTKFEKKLYSKILIFFSFPRREVPSVSKQDLRCGLLCERHTSKRDLVGEAD